ncbi:hypothetical protein [Streptomyces albicerus]|uniref:hypothetical protein n=1 Tax=Streptomyces albicerus TaxID=2569859 RepID=UPI00124AFBB7|nr:hypothetical protein [Streptomyces albicerus]
MASAAVELLVNGKVVASQEKRGKGVTVLAAELPGDPPQPFTVRIDQSKAAGDVPVCVMETGGTRTPVPYAPLAPVQAPSPTAGTPVPSLRWLRRLVRRPLRHMRLRRR